MILTNLNNEFSIISVSGEDSKKFLQGQLTNDINLLDNEKFQFSAHLNNKGRMLASFIIINPSINTYYLITPKEIIENIIKRLKMFVLRSKVIIEQLEQILVYSNNTLNIGLSIEIAPTYFLSIINAIPRDITHDTLDFKNTLINQGISFIYTATQEKFIPQHVNFDKINGVNFKKGCYTGQEIVARTHYLGKSKRSLYRFISDSSLQIGQQVFSPSMNNQEVGIIVEIIQRDYNYFGLISLQNDCTNSAFTDKENKKQLLIQAIE